MKSVRIGSALMLVLVVIFLMLSSTGLVHAAAEDRTEYVCAEDVIGVPTAKEAKTATKIYKLKDTKDALIQAKTKPATSEIIRISDDGIEVTSTCGRENTTGNLCFFLVPRDKDSRKCFQKKKDGSIDDITKNAAQKSFQDLRDRLLDGKADALTRQLISTGELPREFDPLLTQLGKGKGFLGDATRRQVLDQLQALAQENPSGAKDIFKKVLANDASGLQQTLRNAGQNITLDPGTIARISGGVISGDPRLRQELAVLESNMQKISPGTTFRDLAHTASLPSDAADYWKRVNMGELRQEFEKEITDIDRAKYAIACIESSCGDYGAVNKRSYAAGKYQVMPNNIPNWTEKVLGKRLTYNQFLNCPECQEKVFETVFGGYVRECGYGGAALKWFTGTCSPNLGRHDGATTAATYLRKFYRGFGAPASVITALGQGSPFARAKLFGGGSGSGGSGSGGSGSGGGGGGFGGGFGNIGGLIQGVQNLFSDDSGSSRNGDNNERRAPVRPPQQERPEAPIEKPVLNVRTHPPEVEKGDSLQFIWSTTGMSKTQVCVLVDENRTPRTAIAEGNDGTHVYDVPVITDPDVASLEFTLQCVARDKRASPDDERKTVQVRLIN